MEKQERHYDILRLNRLFGISSLVFLVLLVWTFADDYDRSWKKFQREFRALEVGETRGLISEEDALLAASPELAEAQQLLDTARRDVEVRSDEVKRLEKGLSKLNASVYKIQQELAFDKAEYDALKYEYEERTAHGGEDLAEESERLTSYEKRIQQKNKKLQSVESEVAAQNGSLKEVRKAASEGEKKIGELTKRRDLNTRKLMKMDPEAMSIGNRLANAVRDLPMLDFLNPYYKVDQIIVRDVTEDLNFVKVAKVDRCATCHLGIARAGFEDAPEPFRTHPRLDLFLSSSSPHPMETFGCTSCHAGRGRGTDFSTAAHTPDSPEEREEWEAKYGWHHMEYWSTPMFPTLHMEAGCLKCHASQAILQGAPNLDLGLSLIERSGCFGCHVIERYDSKSKTGPSLEHVASKVDRNWAYRWIRNPKEFRHNTWMPQFFGLSNSSDPESVVRTEQEIHAIVHYLFVRSTPYQADRSSRAGNAVRGEELFNAVGCRGCHVVQPEPDGEVTDAKLLRRQHGPNLIGVGTKTTRDWIYSWIKNPSRYHADTRMPNLRLTDGEAADIAAYLSSLRNDEFLAGDVPSINENEVDKIALAFLAKDLSDRDANTRLEGMNREGKLEFVGEKLIRHYGCFGCHAIPGFEKEMPIGTELTEEGAKAIEKLDFGLVHLEHSKEAWFTQKLEDPRIFDQNKLRGPYDRLRMPKFDFTDQEVEAVVTAILGMTKTSARPKQPSARKEFVERGQRLVRDLNCQACHIIEGVGGDIAEVIGLPEFSPPNLNTQGAKTQPDWLLAFLKNPVMIRPNLRVRMPTFDLSDAEWNSIIQYFQFRDGQRTPYEVAHRPELASTAFRAGRQLHTMGACNNCHFYGTAFPKQGPETWAPNLAMVRNRLRPEWVVEWLRNPQVIMPGTKMPAPYVPSAEDLAAPGAAATFGPDLSALAGDQGAALRGLTDYLFTIQGPDDVSGVVKPYFAQRGYGFLAPPEKVAEEFEEWE